MFLLQTSMQQLDDCNTSTLLYPHNLPCSDAPFFFSVPVFLIVLNGVKN